MMPSEIIYTSSPRLLVSYHASPLSSSAESLTSRVAGSGYFAVTRFFTARRKVSQKLILNFDISYNLLFLSQIPDCGAFVLPGPFTTADLKPRHSG